MFRKVLIFIALFSFNSSFTQSFEFTAGDTIVEHFAVDTYALGHTKITNTLDTAVVFKWELITFEHPIDWSFTICDFPFCYTGGETSGTMLAAEALSDAAFLTVNVEATYLDTGKYQFKVWNQAFPEETDTLTIFMISQPNTASLNKNEHLLNTRIFYNSKENSIQLTSHSSNHLYLTIYDLTGRIVYSTKASKENNSPILLPHQLNGTYIIHLSDNKNTHVIQKVFIH